MDLYAGIGADEVRELIESRLGDERALLTAAREEVARAYTDLSIAKLMSGAAGRFHDHDAPDSPRRLRQEAQRRQRTVNELALMRDAARSGDPAVALTVFASETTNPILAADAEELANALSRAA